MQIPVCQSQGCKLMRQDWGLQSGVGDAYRARGGTAKGPLDKFFPDIILCFLNKQQQQCKRLIFSFLMSFFDCILIVREPQYTINIFSFIRLSCFLPSVVVILYQQDHKQWRTVQMIVFMTVRYICTCSSNKCTSFPLRHEHGGGGGRKGRGACITLVHCTHGVMCGCCWCPWINSSAMNKQFCPHWHWLNMASLPYCSKLARISACIKTHTHTLTLYVLFKRILHTHACFNQDTYYTNTYLCVPLKGKLASADLPNN